MAERIYCSELNRHEPMCGTAEVVDVWLLLEYRPSWKAKALPESDLTASTKDWVERSTDTLAKHGLRVRPQLIRQPELDRDDVRLLIGYNGNLVQFKGAGYDFLHNIDLSVLATGGIPAGAEQLHEPRYFVCTNGQRDLCCARFGLPVYASLRDRVGGRVWQVSHLGGHRFAPNVLVLPHGMLYGRVRPESLDVFADCVEARQISFAHLRGRSRYPKHVQAAEALCGSGDLKLLHVNGNEDAATVTFAGTNGKHQVSVQRSATALEVLGSCGDAVADTMFPYQLAEL